MNKIADIPVIYEEINTNINNSTMETPEMTIKEMEAKIAEMKEKQRKQREKESAKYIAERDSNIQKMIIAASDLHEKLKIYKNQLAEIMVHQSEKLEAYGKLRKNSKGGFSITNSQGNMRIIRRRDTEPTWDERGEKGVAMLKDFLADVVKKKDIKTYEILMSFLVKNKNGDLEFSRVMDLLSHEDKYTDVRWIEGLHLLKESYSNVMKGYGYMIQHRPSDGDKWENINLSFASI